MERRYDVYIEGKPLAILTAAPTAATPVHWRDVPVTRDADIATAVAELASSVKVEGIRLFPVGDIDVWKAFRSRYTFVQAAGGIVIDERGRLLAIKRLGRWDLPKGKVDKGEAIPDAALREVREECGSKALELVRPVTHTWHTYERKGRQHLKRTDWFLMRSASTEQLVPQHEEDIEEVRWFSREEADVLRSDTYPSLLPVVCAWEEMHA